jgi:cysteine desulfurase
MAANNETGVINDLSQIASVVRAKSPQALIHSDVAQLVGKIPFSFQDSNLDAVTISGHKFGALSGTGALVVKKEIELEPLLYGGAQEGKLRGGTENVLGIIALGAVAAQIETELGSRLEAMRAARDTFEECVLSSVAEAQINGFSEMRLPNTASIFIPGVRADDVVVALDLEGVLISSGAACSSGKPEPSHVLLAMGQDETRVRSTIRVSFRADQTTEVARLAASRLASVVARMRSVR